MPLKSTPSAVSCFPAQRFLCFYKDLRKVFYASFHSPLLSFYSHCKISLCLVFYIIWSKNPNQICRFLSSTSFFTRPLKCPHFLILFLNPFVQYGCFIISGLLFQKHAFWHLSARCPSSAFLLSPIQGLHLVCYTFIYLLFSSY